MAVLGFTLVREFILFLRKLRDFWSVLLTMAESVSCQF